jgi:hypothetical protein
VWCDVDLGRRLGSVLFCLGLILFVVCLVLIFCLGLIPSCLGLVVLARRGLVELRFLVLVLVLVSVRRFRFRFRVRRRKRGEPDLGKHAVHCRPQRVLAHRGCGGERGGRREEAGVPRRRVEGVWSCNLLTKLSVAFIPDRDQDQDKDQDQDEPLLLTTLNR